MISYEMWVILKGFWYAIIKTNTSNLATWPIYTVVHCFFLLAHVTILIIVNNCLCYNVNNALGGRGSRPPGAWLKHGAVDKLSAAKLSQAPCFSEGPEGLNPRPPVR